MFAAKYLNENMQIEKVQRNGQAAAKIFFIRVWILKLKYVLTELGMS
jgi:hypothetical protein